jgi:hypothetical protein
VTSKVLGYALNISGIKVPEEVLDVVVKGGKKMMATKGYVNLKQLFEDQEFRELIATFQAKIPEYIADSANGVDIDGDGKVDIISTDAVVRCVHCDNVFRLGDAIPQSKLNNRN